MRFDTTVDIAAPRERVWAILTDVTRWPEWTASMTSVERLDAAALAVGSRARIRQPRMPALVWEVTEFALGQSFSWRATSAGVTTLADHRLTDLPNGQTRATLGITQSGPLAWLVGLLTGGMARRYVRMEAEGLKRRSEAA